VAILNRFLSANQMKITSFNIYFEQLSLAWWITSGISSASQDCGEKWSIWKQAMVFGMLNDKFVARGLVQEHLPWPHYLQCMHTWSAVAMTVNSANFE